MKTLKNILIGLLILTAVSYLLPNTWSVERSVIINAPPAKIYPLVSNLETGWSQWSAFDHEDPNIKYTYFTGGREWKSEKMGDGWQSLTKADPESGIEFELVMKKNNFKIDGQIHFQRVPEGTRVTWKDWGPAGSNPIHRWMTLFMDKMIGKNFEKSLAKLKEIVESK
jgi:hypothetical protein